MRLNKKGYMLVEIIIASVLAMSIAFYLLNLTYKFKDTSEDIYHSYNYMNDKISITKNIMYDLEKGIIFGDISPIDDDYNKGITFSLKLDDKNPEFRKLLIEKDRDSTIIKYGKTSGNDFDTFDTSDVSYYEKKLNSTLVVETVEISESGANDPDSLTIKIPIKSIYDDEDYSVKLYAKKYEINEMKVLFASKDSKNYFKSDTYRTYIKTAYFVNYINTTDAVSTDTVWDVSEKGDNSVVAWLEPNATEGYYDLYIGSNNGEKIYSESLKYFFKDCIKLEKIDLNNFDASITTSLRSMFSDCGELNNIILLSSFNTSNVTDMGYMFKNCPNLTNLESILENIDTSSVTDMEGMFQYCSNLTNLDLSNFNTSSVTNMKYLFHSCSSLESLVLSNFDTSSFDTSSVTTMYGMFYNCSSLTNLNLSSNFNTSSVSDMGAMFYGCSSLTNLNLSSNFNTSSVSYMRAMFYKCSSLESLDLNNFDTSNVTNMALMFGECRRLKSLVLSSFDTSNVENMYGMFGGCSSLTSLNLSNFDTSNVTKYTDIIEVGGVEVKVGIFENCSLLQTTITIKSNDPTLILDDYYIQMFANAATGKDDGGNYIGLITVNYTTETSDLVDAMIATGTGNVVKGDLIE